MPEEAALGAEVVAEARERTAGMTAAERRQLVARFREHRAADPAGAGALLGVDTTAAMTLLVAQLELGLLADEAVQRALQEEAALRAQRSSAAAAAGARPEEEGYSQYQLELLRQVRVRRRPRRAPPARALTRSAAPIARARAAGRRADGGDDAGPLALPAAAAPHAAARDAHERGAPPGGAVTAAGALETYVRMGPMMTAPSAVVPAAADIDL